MFIAPDIEERRGDNFLMVWGDIPYWTVVDTELRYLLGSLNGAKPLVDVIKSTLRYTQRRQARKAIQLLASRGVVRYGAKTSCERRASVPSRIENIAVNVTRRCNLRCQFCYNLECLVTSSEGELSLADMINVLDASRPFWADSPVLSLLGGEPLLDADKTLGLLAYARRNGLAPIVSTNGTALTPSFAMDAAKQNTEVQVSLDGAVSGTNDQIRGTGSFVRAVAGVKMLVEAGAHTILSMVCHRTNFSELQQFYELGLSLGVSEVRFIPLKRIGGTDASVFKPVPLDELITSAIALFREHPEYKPLTGRDAFSIIASNCRHAMDRRSCGTGVQTFLLDANGDIYPCLNTNVPSLRVANVREPDFSFAKLWRESTVLQELRCSTSICSMTNACRECAVRCWCLGGCRGETLATRGDLRLNAWNCTEQRRTIVETMWALSETPSIVRLAQPTVF
jgi:radical SAM protein with 4Fe4S-binding SPASM domain